MEREQEKAKTNIEVTKTTWDNFKKASEKDGLRLMVSLEKALELYIDSITSKQF